MAVQAIPGQLIELLHEIMGSLVRRNGPHLTARQFSIFLIVHLGDGPHTVRSLAAALNVPRGSVTRGLDRLGKFELARRKTDPKDRRSVLVQRTAKGAALLREISITMNEAAAPPSGDCGSGDRTAAGRQFVKLAGYAERCRSHSPGVA